MGDRTALSAYSLFLVLNSMNDQHWLELIKKGDQTAFRELIEHYRPLVYRTTAKFVTDVDDRNDLTQEVFIEVWRSINKFRGDSSVSTWIYRITVNKALNLVQRAKRRNWYSGLLRTTDYREPETRADETASGLLRSEGASLINKALDALPGNQRAVFVLSKAEGLSQKEVAAVMELTEKAVESLLHRARTNLRKKLSHYYSQ